MWKKSEAGRKIKLSPSYYDGLRRDYGELDDNIKLEWARDDDQNKKLDAKLEKAIDSMLDEVKPSRALWLQWMKSVRQLSERDRRGQNTK